MSQTSTAFSWSQSQSQYSAQSQSQTQQKPKYGPTGRSQVHSAGCIRDGQVICACDRPAVRRISRTKLNPDRPFYCCASDQCTFWKWEDKLLGTGLNFPQAQNRGQGHHPNPAPVTEPSVKQEDNPSLPTSSPLTPRGPVSVTNGINSKQNVFQQSTSPQSNHPPAGAKRSYARMSTGGAPPVPPKVRHEMTEDERAAAKARRDESIRLALLEHGADADADEEDEVIRHMEADDERDGVTQNKATGGDESTGPASKKTRFANTIKVEEVGSTELPSQIQSQMPSTPLRPSGVSFNSQLPTPSQTSGRRVTAARTGADIEVDDFYEAEGPPSPTSFTKAAQRAKERERFSALDSTVPPLRLSPDKGKVRESVHEEQPTQNNAQNGQTNDTSHRIEVSDPGPSSRRASQERHANNRHDHGHHHDEERELKTGSFAVQLASTITGSSSNIRTPTPTRVTHPISSQPSSTHTHVVRQSSPQSAEKHFSITANPYVNSSQFSRSSQQDLTQQFTSSFPSSSLSSSSPSSHLQSIVAEMAAQQTNMQAALSIVTAHQATLETALHDYVSESDKSRRKVKALEKSVACKDKEITRLREKVEELRKRNAELEAFQVRFEQFKRTAPGPSFPG